MTGLRQVGLHAALALGAVFFLAPFVMLVAASFSRPEDLAARTLLASPPTLDNYRAALTSVPLVRYFANSIVVTTTILVFQILTGLPAAYALARVRFRGASLGLGMVLLCLMIPHQLAAIPLYVLFARLGLIDTRVALIAPFAVSAFGIYLFRQFILTIPAEVFDAARMDGASTVSVLARVVLPMCRPAILVFAVASFTGHWNDYFWPSFVLTHDRAATVPMGVASFTIAEGGTDYGVQLALATMSVAPLLAGFVVAQRYLARGLALSSAEN